MAGPTDEQGAAGVLLVRLGRNSREVPVLPIKYAKAWKQHLWETLAEIKGSAGDVAPLAAMDPDAAVAAVEERVLGLDDLAVERAIDLVMEFDREHVLGTRDQIEEQASPRDIRRALDAMRDECFPFGEEMTLMNMLQVVVARSTPPSSTNGHSPIGASPQDHLKKRSRIASSASSGKQARPG